MILELEQNTTPEQKEKLLERLQQMGFRTAVQEEGRITIVHGVDSTVKKELFTALPHVRSITPLSTTSKLVSKASKSGPTIIEVKGKKIGDGNLFIVAGPCSIETREQMEAAAKAAFESGAQALRGGAFKPRTSPYDFQGLGEEGLKILRETADRYGLLAVTEVMDASQIELAAKYADILQIGTRNMQNFSLLKELGKVKNPILLKRGFSATYQDLLMSAEYILSAGNPNVILCERGIRTFETHTRNTLDLNAIPALHEMTHLPVFADPSHGTGLRSLVAPMAKASVAAGADGIMLEIHPDPDKSYSDAQQTIGLEAFAKLVKQMKVIHEAMI
ncbi:MAG: bifunctional 3-deoxy-7-phosphoheptulonate synthase/chorismate mutase [Verrucomicrobia bacterium]|nr:bifunctional 3-deoxy-7-phosphoheptulonate synthase/chorismate mutase [Verrucomicrobiota bacterium]